MISQQSSSRIVPGARVLDGRTRDRRFDPDAGRMKHSAYPLKLHAFDALETTQAGFVREATELLGNAYVDVILDASNTGLTIFGRSEPALAAPIERLLEYFGRDRLRFSGPHVRHWPGTPVHEPIMTLLVRVPRHLSATVQRELASRNATAVEVRAGALMTVIRAEASQVALIGYPSWLDSMSCGLGELAIRLSRYQPLRLGEVSDPGPSAD